jgi:hypothetical protein
MSLGGSGGQALKAGRRDIGAGRGCCASARGRGRRAGNPGGTADSERCIHIGRCATSGTGAARRNSSRCCHIYPLKLLFRFSPGGLPRVRLAAVRASLRMIEIQRARANFTCGFERPKLMPSGKQWQFSSTDECEAKPFTDDARDFRARNSQIHKRYPLAM